MTAILQVENLIKHYKTLRAVAGISFEITQGECFGLLGPNGAGKTTTIEIIEGVLTPSSGTILFQQQQRNRSYHDNIGILLQATSLPERLSVLETLTTFQKFYPAPRKLDDLIGFCDLTPFLHQYTEKLSGGQRQRLLLALALVNDPKLIFLDEPTTGLDPNARRQFWNLINQIKSEGKTLILTTHYMEEAYGLCDRIAIMNLGKIIAQGSPRDLLKSFCEGVTICIPKDAITVDLTTFPSKYYFTDSQFEIITTDVETTIRLLLDFDIPLAHMQIREGTLEDLYINLTKQQGPLP